MLLCFLYKAIYKLYTANFRFPAPAIGTDRRVDNKNRFPIGNKNNKYKLIQSLPFGRKRSPKDSGWIPDGFRVDSYEFRTIWQALLKAFLCLKTFADRLQSTSLSLPFWLMLTSKLLLNAC